MKYSINETFGVTATHIVGRLVCCLIHSTYTTKHKFPAMEEASIQNKYNLITKNAAQTVTFYVLKEHCRVSLDTKRNHIITGFKGIVKGLPYSLMTAAVNNNKL